VRVWTREPVDGRRELSGRLVLVDEGALLVAPAAPDGPVQVPRSLLAKVRLEVESR
jgi:ribosome maturation factor RimP